MLDIRLRLIDAEALTCMQNPSPDKHVNALERSRFASTETTKTTWLGILRAKDNVIDELLFLTDRCPPFFRSCPRFGRTVSLFQWVSQLLLVRLPFAAGPLLRQPEPCLDVWTADPHYRSGAPSVPGRLPQGRPLPSTAGMASMLSLQEHRFSWSMSASCLLLCSCALAGFLGCECILGALLNTNTSAAPSRQCCYES